MVDNYSNKSPKAALIVFLVLLITTGIVAILALKNPPKFSINFSEWFATTPDPSDSPIAIDTPYTPEPSDVEVAFDAYEADPTVSFAALQTYKSLISNQESLDDIDWCQPFINDGTEFLDITQRQYIPKRSSDFEYTVAFDGETYHFMSYYSMPVGKIGEYEVISHAFTCQSQSDYILEVKNSSSGISSVYPYVLRHLESKDTALFTTIEPNWGNSAPTIAAYVLNEFNGLVRATRIDNSVCAQNNTVIGLNHDFSNYFMVSHTYKSLNHNSIICVVNLEGKVRNAFLGNLPWREVKMFGKDRFAPSFTMVSLYTPSKRNDFAVFTEKSDQNTCGFFTIPADKPNTAATFTYVKEMHVSGVCGMFAIDIAKIK